MITTLWCGRNGAVRFCASRKVFGARNIFNIFTVGSKHFKFVFFVAAKMIVQSFPANLATHALPTILAPKNDNFTVEDVALLRCWKRSAHIFQA